MEGVVVSARRDCANFTVSVVSDAQGKYSFPRTHLQPGKYTLTIRAVGYDLRGPASVDVAESKLAIADLKLVKTAKDLAAQLSSLEWAMSVPGTPEQKDKVIYQTVSCAYCHTWQRVVRSNHTADEFVDLITRMQKYYTDGSAVSTDHRGRGQFGPPDQVAAADTNPDLGPRAFRCAEKGLGRVPRHHQPQRRQDHLALRAQDAAAPQRQGHARHHHPVRHAPARHRRARSRPRFRRHHLVHRRKPHVFRKNGSQDRSVHRVPAAARAARRLARRA